MSRRSSNGRLVRIDDRLVPKLAAAIRAVGRGARGLSRVGGRPGRWLAGGARRNPTITTAVVAVAAAAALILTTGGDQRHSVAPAPLNSQVALPGNQLGPTTGEQVSTYLAAAAQRADQLQGTTATSVTAIVDFSSYLTAAAADSVLAGQPGVQAVRAYVRVPPPQSGTVHTVALGTGSDLALDLSRLAATARQTVVSYRKHVALANRHPTPQNVQVVTQYAALARQAKVDARGISATSGCVFALQITGPPAQVRALAATSDVRVVDPAPPTVSAADLMIVPLEPQVTGVVPPPNFAVQ